MTVEFKQATLDNGLTIIAEVDDAAHTSAIGFFVKTGARDEVAEVMGVSHFLEHMMFKGTESRTATDVDREFDDLGAEHNAYTSVEMTAFWAHCLPEKLTRATEILADILRPALRQQDFDDEKKVILEEIAMYQDQPFWVLYERAMEVYYGDHPLSHRVLGTVETIENLPRDAMAAYFENRYSADNTVVALAGKLDFDAMVNDLRARCGGWTRTNARRDHVAVVPGAETFTVDMASAARHYLLMVSPAPAIGDDRRYAAGMLASILGDAEGSRFYWALIETGLAEEAHAQYDGRDGVGDYLVYAVCSPEDVAQVERLMREQIEGLADSLTDDDLQRVRAKVATGITLSGELPAGRMRRLGRLWTYTGEHRALEDELARINAVTLDELRDVAAAFPLRPMTVGHLAAATVAR
ncbi:MAG: M16 family metallopeptidase [Planctomycetota bacterium]|jgi:predicted Zn-dependent peptidase